MRCRAATEPAAGMVAIQAMLTGFALGVGVPDRDSAANANAGEVEESLEPSLWPTDSPTSPALACCFAFAAHRSERLRIDLRRFAHSDFSRGHIAHRRVLATASALGQSD
jgi:hypothetical protein